MKTYKYHAFGTSKCGTILVERLLELNNPKLIRRMLHIYAKSKAALKKIYKLDCNVQLKNNLIDNYLFFRRNQIDEWFITCHNDESLDLCKRLQHVIGI